MAKNGLRRRSATGELDDSLGKRPFHDLKVEQAGNRIMEARSYLAKSFRYRLSKASGSFLSR